MSKRPSAWSDLNLDDGLQCAVREKELLKHKQRVGRVKSIVSNGPPRNFPQISSFADKVEKKQKHVQKRNGELLTNLTKIHNKKRAKPAPPKLSRSNTFFLRREREKRITQENQRLVNRIVKSKPTIDRREQNQHWERHKKAVSNRNAVRKRRKQMRPTGHKAVIQHIKYQTPKSLKHNTTDTLSFDDDKVRIQSISKTILNYGNADKPNFTMPPSISKKSIHSNTNQMPVSMLKSSNHRIKTNHELLSDYEGDDMWLEREKSQSSSESMRKSADKVVHVTFPPI